ncbi:MAG: HEAT repeat domain-containing protein [Pirellulales bacterium]
MESLEGGITTDELKHLPRVLALASGKDDDVRASAFALIGAYAMSAEARQKYGPTMLDEIAAGLDSENDYVRKMSVITARAKLIDETERGVGVLIAALRNEDEQVRWMAATTLGEIRTSQTQVVAALRTALDDQDWLVRSPRPAQLAGHAPASEVAVDRLLELLGDGHGEVSAAAIHTLTKLGEPAAAEMLALDNQKRPHVREFIAHGLGTMRAIAGLNEATNGKIEARMLSWLDDVDRKVRCEAAIRLSIFGDLEARIAALPILVDNAQDKDDGGTLVGWNAYLGIQRCVVTFAAALKDENTVDAGMRGFAKLEKPFLRDYLRATHKRFAGSEGGDVRPIFRQAAEKSPRAAAREFAAEVVSWLPRDES